MKKVDFAYVHNDGSTIYRMCFQKYIDKRFPLKKSKAEWAKLVPRTEEVFDFLVAEGRKNGFDVDSILQIPDSSGLSCFIIASQCSEKICKYIFGRGIKVNSIRTNMMIPNFYYHDLAIQMMLKGINPHVIAYDGFSQVDLFPSSFGSEEAKQLLAQFSRSIHFAIKNIDCEDSCPVNCHSKFRRFYYKNGALVEMTDKNRIGRGGFGMVFRQVFHGKLMAMKCVIIGEIKWRPRVNETVSDLEKSISELRIQEKIGTVGSGVIVPVAYVRQQNQEQDANGKWVAQNYHIYIYPLYDCNLRELRECYSDKFLEEILADIIAQCFKRKGFPLKHSS